jgi:citrate synthase
MPKDTLSITDNRTGKTYEVPVADGTIKAMDLRQIKAGPDDFGLMTYDPAFMNTASCRSAITFIDGDKGILRYRGYPIEELAAHSSYLETAYLVINGELPTKAQLDDWQLQIADHYIVHENIKKFVDGFHYNAHPMGMLVSSVGALSTYYEDSKDIFNPTSRLHQILRLLGKMPTLAAYAYRHSKGLPYEYPDPRLS